MARTPSSLRCSSCPEAVPSICIRATHGDSSDTDTSLARSTRTSAAQVPTARERQMARDVWASTAQENSGVWFSCRKVG